MEKKQETTVVYWGYIGIIWDNGKSHGSNYLGVEEVAVSFEASFSLRFIGRVGMPGSIW